MNPSRSRWIQLGLNLYFCTLYGVYCVWTVFNPPSENVDTFAIVFLICGWVAFPLYISQIFFINTVSSEFPECRENDKDQRNSEGPQGVVKINIYLI